MERWVWGFSTHSGRDTLCHAVMKSQTPALRRPQWGGQGLMNTRWLPAVHSPSHPEKSHIRISCLCHSPSFQKPICPGFEATKTFLVNCHQLYLVKPHPKALSPRLPLHILSWLLLCFLAIPPGDGRLLLPLLCNGPCKHSSIPWWPWLQSSLIPGLRLSLFPTQPVSTVDNQVFFASSGPVFISLLSLLLIKTIPNKKPCQGLRITIYLCCIE